MLTHPTLEKLQQLRLSGMRQALEEQLHMPDIATLGFEERLGLLVDREYTLRESRRLKARLAKAKLRQNACVEDIDYRAPRGLDKALMTQLATGGWLREHLNCLIIGPTVTPTSCTPRYVIENSIPVVCHSPVTTPHARPFPPTSDRLAESPRVPLHRPALRVIAGA